MSNYQHHDLYDEVVPYVEQDYQYISMAQMIDNHQTSNPSSYFTPRDALASTDYTFGMSTPGNEGFGLQDPFAASHAPIISTGSSMAQEHTRRWNSQVGGIGAIGFRNETMQSMASGSSMALDHTRRWNSHLGGNGATGFRNETIQSMDSTYSVANHFDYQYPADVEEYPSHVHHQAYQNNDNVHCSGNDCVQNEISRHQAQEAAENRTRRFYEIAEMSERRNRQLEVPRESRPFTTPQMRVPQNHELSRRTELQLEVHQDHQDLVDPGSLSAHSSSSTHSDEWVDDTPTRKTGGKWRPPPAIKQVSRVLFPQIEEKPTSLKHPRSTEFKSLGLSSEADEKKARLSVNEYFSNVGDETDQEEDAVAEDKKDLGFAVPSHGQGKKIMSQGKDSKFVDVLRGRFNSTPKPSTLYTPRKYFARGPRPVMQGKGMSYSDADKQNIKREYELYVRQAPAVGRLYAENLAAYISDVIWDKYGMNRTANAVKLCNQRWIRGVGGGVDDRTPAKQDANNLRTSLQYTKQEKADIAAAAAEKFAAAAAKLPAAIARLREERFE